MFLRMLGLMLSDRGYEVQYFHRAEDHLALEGLVVSALAFGVVDGDSFCFSKECLPPNLKALEINNLELAGCLAGDVEERVGLQKESKWPGLDDKTGLEVKNCLQKAGEIWARISSRYCKNLDGRNFKSQAANLAQQIMDNPVRVKHFFAGAVTPDGPVNFIPHLIASCHKRYFIKGFPGTGSFLMNEMLLQALYRHYDVEIYHSFLNPEELVMLILPESSVAVVDGTSGCGHAHLAGDTVWDITAFLESGYAGRDEEQIAAETKELERLLAAAGMALSKLDNQEEHWGLIPSEDEISAIVSRILKETASPDRVSN